MSVAWLGISTSSANSEEVLFWISSPVAHFLRREEDEALGLTARPNAAMPSPNGMKDSRGDEHAHMHDGNIRRYWKILHDRSNGMMTEKKILRLREMNGKPQAASNATVS